MNILTAFGGAALAAGVSVCLSAQAPPARAIISRASAHASTVIQGNALDSSNAPLPDSRVRLRDARIGRIVDAVTTDKSGLFVFHAIDPGTYIVELNRDAIVVAASQLISINVGETISTVVKLPLKMPVFGGLLGDHPHGATAAAIVGAAASSGILTTAATGFPVTPE